MPNIQCVGPRMEKYTPRFFVILVNPLKFKGMILCDHGKNVMLNKFTSITSHFFLQSIPN